MGSTLTAQAARKLGCRESIAAAFVKAVLSKNRQGWKPAAIAEWLVSWLDPNDPAASTEFVTGCSRTSSSNIQDPTIPTKERNLNVY